MTKEITIPFSKKGDFDCKIEKKIKNAQNIQEKKISFTLTN